MKLQTLPGGISVNVSLVGEPSVWHEKSGISHPTAPGTFNIILHMDASLSLEVFARSLVTCTKAKTSTLQDLLPPYFT